MTRSQLAQCPIEVAPLLFFDIETSGLRPDRGARITEWALVDHRGLRLSWDADPSEPAYDQALTQQLEELFEALQDGVVVGHHLAFDFGFVAREADRLDIPGPRLWFIDTLALSRRLSVPTPNARLETLLKHFDCLPGRPLHSAPVDARATQALFWKLVAYGQLDTLADAGVKPLTWSTA